MVDGTMSFDSRQQSAVLTLVWPKFFYGVERFISKVNQTVI